MGKTIERMDRFLSMRGRRKGRKGSVLVVALLFATVLSILGVAYLGLIASEAKITPRSFSSANALNVAEAGAEIALWELKYSGADFTSNEGWSGTTSKTKTSSIQVADGTAIGEYSVTVTDISTTPKIEATGYAPDSTQPEGARKVRVVVRKDTSPFDYALFSGGSLTMSGNGKANSYDSTVTTSPTTFNSNGNIGSNSSISLSGNSGVYGNATPGPESSVTIGSNAYVTGSTTAASSTTSLPAIDASSWPTGTSELRITQSTESVSLIPGTYTYTSISVSGDGNLSIGSNVKIYVSGSVSISGTGTVAIADDVVLCATGDVSVSGNGIFNTGKIPSDLVIYSTGSSISFTGNSTFYGAVYAPNATVQLAGNGDVYGSVIGNSVSVTGDGSIHYDQALKNLETILTGTYKVDLWQEK